jgi:uridine kinase
MKRLFVKVRDPLGKLETRAIATKVYRDMEPSRTFVSKIYTDPEARKHIIKEMEHELGKRGFTAEDIIKHWESEAELPEMK